MLTGVLLAAALSFTGQDAAVAFRAATDFVSSNVVREAGTARGRLAAMWLLDRAAASGADARLDTFRAPSPTGERVFTNVIAEFRRDRESPWIVLLSHYDTKPGVDCPGANDGGSTSGLLLAFCGVLFRTRDLPCNVMLVWTDGEECRGACYTPDDGFQGSRRMAAKLKESGRSVRAVVCLDMLGDGDLRIIVPANGTPDLRLAALAAARKAGLAEGTVRLEDVLVKDDHVAFLDAGFRAIDLIDFTYGSAPGLNDYWHTKADTPDKLSSESLRKSGALVAELIGILL